MSVGSYLGLTAKTSAPDPSNEFCMTRPFDFLGHSRHQDPYSVTVETRPREQGGEMHGGMVGWSGNNQLPSHNQFKLETNTSSRFMQQPSGGSNLYPTNNTTSPPIYYSPETQITYVACTDPNCHDFHDQPLSPELYAPPTLESVYPSQRDNNHNNNNVNMSEPSSARYPLPVSWSSRPSPGSQHSSPMLPYNKGQQGSFQETQEQTPSFTPPIPSTKPQSISLPSTPKQKRTRSRRQSENIDLNADYRKKYSCNIPNCDKSFTTSGHLARHKRLHR